MAKLMKMATCVRCGCTDEKGCELNEEGYSCTWIHVDYRAGVGICCRCVNRESVNKYKSAVITFLTNNPHLATAKEKKEYKIKIKNSINRRKFLSNERRMEGRVE